jgi:phosphoenolpyruvate carboxylase
VSTNIRNVTPKHPAANANRARADFLQIDSEVGLTFSGIALTATDTEKRRRTIKVAREAFDTIMRLRGNAELTDEEESRLDRNLLRLKGELQSLGETF